MKYILFLYLPDLTCQNKKKARFAKNCLPENAKNEHLPKHNLAEIILALDAWNARPSS